LKRVDVHLCACVGGWGWGCLGGGAGCILPWQLEKMVRDHENASAAIQANLDVKKEEYRILKAKFQELQKGFLLGQLQDEMKEILLGELEEVVPASQILQYDLSAMHCALSIPDVECVRDSVSYRVQEKLGGGDVAEAMGEQSAMQKLIQQLKDSRQALVNAQDDMNFWKGKYHGLQV